MTTVAGCFKPSRRRRKSMSLASALMLIPTLLPGCASPTKPRWSDSATPSPSPSLLSSQSIDRRAKFESLKPGAPSKPETAPTGALSARDAGLVRTASAETPSETMQSIISTPVIPPPVQEYPIDLTTALRLAEVENPMIAEARQRIGEALAVQQGARALLLPSLNVGTNFHGHSGDLQRSSGRILKLNEQSLYFGGGAGVSAAGTLEVPAVSIISPLTDAFFEPLAARQQVDRAGFNAAATANRILLEVAELHFELLAAEADLDVRRKSATQETEVARLTRAYADAKQGREADAERAATELNLIVDEIRQAEEEAAVAAARLRAPAPSRAIGPAPPDRTGDREGDDCRSHGSRARPDPGRLAGPPRTPSPECRAGGGRDPPPAGAVSTDPAHPLARLSVRGYSAAAAT